MRHKTSLLAPILALVVTAIPTAAWATHEVTDERPATALEDFRQDVGSWIDPWLDISGTSLADDHAPWVAFGLYEELLGTRPEPCYWDTYAAYWAVAADMRAMGQAPDREQQEALTERIFEDLAHADALAELEAARCQTWGNHVGEVAEQETTQTPALDPLEQTGSPRVIEIEVTAALQFTDEHGNRLEEIAVSPGETLLFQIHNSAGFEHSFYIGSEEELEVPLGTTDTGVGPWQTGVRELEWSVPADVSGLMFGCTVPGHFLVSHGVFVVAPPSNAPGRPPPGGSS